MNGIIFYEIKKKKDMETHESYMYFLTLLITDETYIALTYMTGILPIKGYKKTQV